MPPSQSTRSMSIRSQPESTKWWETTNCAGSFVRAASPRPLAFPGTTRLSARGQRCRQAWTARTREACAIRSESASPARDSRKREGEDSQIATDREILDVVAFDSEALLERQ